MICCDIGASHFAAFMPALSRYNMHELLQQNEKPKQLQLSAKITEGTVYDPLDSAFNLLGQYLQ